MAGHCGGVSSCSDSPDGRQIAEGSMTGAIRIFDAASGRLERRIRIAGVANAPFVAATARMVRRLRSRPIAMCGSWTWRPVGRSCGKGNDGNKCRLHHPPGRQLRLEPRRLAPVLRERQPDRAVGSPPEPGSNPRPGDHRRGRSLQRSLVRRAEPRRPPARGRGSPRHRAARRKHRTPAGDNRAEPNHFLACPQP